MPAALGIVVHTKGAEAALEKAAGHAGNFAPVFRGRIAPDVADHLRRQFESNGAHLGTPWEPLRVTTIRLRTRVKKLRGGAVATTNRAGRARYGFSTPMRDTGRAFQSLARLTASEGIREYAPLRMAFGSRVPYLEPHHRPNGFFSRVFGQGQPKHVPGRPVVPQTWPAPIVAQWSGWMLDHVTQE